MIAPSDVVYAGVASLCIGVCAYCVWNGRRVMKVWVDKSVPWEEDDNNPANWYLKNPEKFKVGK